MRKSDICDKFCHLINLKFTSNRTIESYCNVFNKFTSIFSRVERLSKNEIESYLIEFRRKYSISYYNQMVSILKILYIEVLGQPRKVKDLKVLKDSKKAVSLIHPSRFWKIYEELGNIKHKAILLTLITTGVRSSELLGIKLSHIDRDYMRILISSGKGGVNRYVRMEMMLLKLLEVYYRQYKPKVYLFEGLVGEKYSKSSLTKIVKKCDSTWYPHLFRHTYFTYLAVKGFNPFFAMNLAGHKRIESQSQYIHFSPRWIDEVPGLGDTYKSA